MGGLEAPGQVDDGVRAGQMPVQSARTVVAREIDRGPLHSRDGQSRQPAREADHGCHVRVLRQGLDHTGAHIAGGPGHHDAQARVRAHLFRLFPKCPARSNM